VDDATAIGRILFIWVVLTFFCSARAPLGRENGCYTMEVGSCGLCLCLGNPWGDVQRYGTGGILSLRPNGYSKVEGLSPLPLVQMTKTLPRPSRAMAMATLFHQGFCCWTKVNRGAWRTHTHTHTQCLPHSHRIGNSKSSHAYTYIYDDKRDMYN
jgi:hypothetical protein